ncbi:nonsense-mediated mRNA decay factor SMG9 [Oratosquilla oratoria]|uniref:nonsense-mediated mRNA decay factor SMG9 n=1 Tax=Oratosquilla oratoria TaxID=337810 RepID=UPI003F776EBE
MADAGDRGKEKKKKRKAYLKPERELESFLPDTMRAPVIQVLGKSGSEGKPSMPSASSPGSHDSHFWERPRTRHYGDWEKPGGTLGSYRLFNGRRDSHDMGRPPGRKGEDSGGGVEGHLKADGSGNKIPSPVILSRIRSSSEQRSTSPQAVSTLRKDSSASVGSGSSGGQQIQIASKPSTLEATLVPDKVMKAPLKLLDESLSVGDDLAPYLMDQSNFFVIAAIGTQGVGKSTLLSLLVDPQAGVGKSRYCTFRPESLDQVVSGIHATNGVDIYVTQDRLILLDCQPLLSPSIMDKLITHEKKFTSEYSSTENLMEIESLQLVTLMMSIAHVVILVQDYSLDPNMVRLLQTCEMLKPIPVGVTGEEAHQFFPHMVVVHNRVGTESFTPTFMRKLQAIYRESLANSCLEGESRIGLCNAIMYSPLNQTTCGSLANLFLLPDSRCNHNGPVKFLESVEEMRRQVVSLRRNPMTHGALSEKTWYQHACRTWETVRKSSLFLEYSRLLP